MLLPTKIDHIMYSKIIKISISPEIFTENAIIDGNYSFESNLNLNDSSKLKMKSGDIEDPLENFNFNFSIVN